MSTALPEIGRYLDKVAWLLFFNASLIFLYKRDLGRAVACIAFATYFMLALHLGAAK
jgi:hypothetical protein